MLCPEEEAAPFERCSKSQSDHTCWYYYIDSSFIAFGLPGEAAPALIYEGISPCLVP